MPQELPKKLPPRREVDHQIELELDAKPSAMAPYRMAPPELEELRSPKQARWQDFLAEFDYRLEYKPGKANVVADALSRKAELAAINMSQPQSTFVSRIKEGLQQDPLAKSLIKLANEGKTRRFWLDEGVLLTTGNRMYVPKWGNLRKEIIKECHDSKWAGHPGMTRTLALLQNSYYWP
ncbi:hypothetical protein LWI29_038387 [Acer saccharum]|uniref:Integrase zinc-binding domain-containing protein n=1 Tax=Acer saccharum TaxID=4024 RepID=A0AA39TCC4_ACESA|nr:hypothetical protein LWI29_038387 [Acer saccharum]